MSEATALLTVQDLDVQLLRLAATLAKMPQQARLKTIALAHKKVTSELTGIVGQRKDAEIEIADTEESLAHYREKAAEVQAEADARAHTHREVKDIEFQLTSLAKRIEKCEFGLGPLHDKLDRLTRAEKNAEATLAKIDEERAATEASLNADSKDLKAQIVKLSRERVQAASELSAEHLAAYEAARKRFKGLAVEQLRGNMPSVCCVKLQPSQFSDLARGPEVTECPYCHRMLVTSGALE